MSDKKDEQDTDGQESSGDDDDKSKSGEQQQSGPPPKTFTQAELDTILAERLARAKPSDYDDLKTKAAEYDKAQEAGRTELEKAQAAQAKAEGERDAANAAVSSSLIRAAITAEATAAGANSVNAVVAMLASDSSVAVKDGEVEGVKNAIKDLKKSEPGLFGERTGGAPGGEFGGQTTSSVSEKIKEAEAKGDYDTSRQLKIGRMVGKR